MQRLQCVTPNDNNTSPSVAEINVVPGSLGASNSNKGCCATVAGGPNCDWKSDLVTCLNTYSNYSINATSDTRQSVTNFPNTGVQTTCPLAPYNACPQIGCSNGNTPICTDPTCKLDSCVCGGPLVYYLQPFTLRAMFGVTGGNFKANQMATGWVHLSTDSGSISDTSNIYEKANATSEPYGGAPQTATWIIESASTKTKNDPILFGDFVYMKNIGVAPIKNKRIGLVNHSGGGDYRLGVTYRTGAIAEPDGGGTNVVDYEFQVLPIYPYQKTGTPVTEGEPFYLLVTNSDVAGSVLSLHTDDDGGPWLDVNGGFPLPIAGRIPFATGFSMFNAVGDVTYIKAQTKCSSSQPCPANYSCINGLCNKSGYIPPRPPSSPSTPPPNVTGDKCGTINNINYGDCKDPNTYCNSDHNCVYNAPVLPTPSQAPAPAAPTAASLTQTQKIYLIIGFFSIISVIIIVAKIMSSKSR